MKKSFLILLVSLFSCFAFSQTTEENILKDEEFIKLKKESITYYTSDFYINYVKDNKDFKDKLPEKYYTDDHTNFENWVKKNIKLTKFKSVEEALELYKQDVDRFVSNKEGEAEINNLFFKLEKKYGRDVFNSVYREYVFTEFYKVWQEKRLK